MTAPVSSTLSNLQQELLKLYTRNISEDDLSAIRMLIGLYFAERTTRAMDTFISEQNLSPQQVAQWAYEHWRSQNRA